MECSAEKTERDDLREGIILAFPWGMPGLEYFEYILTSLGSDKPFYFLQSTVQPEVGMLLVNPFDLFKDYEFDLSEEAVGLLKIRDGKKSAVLCVVNTSRGIESATVNLQAPVVINTDNLLAKQVVLNDKRYSLRTPLGLKRAAEKEEG